MIRIFQFILILFFATGCVQNISNVSKGNGVQEINNQQLNNKIVILNTNKRILNGFLDVAVNIRNISSDTIDLEYRFVWFDSNGFKVNETPWLPITLNGKQSKQIEQIAHSKDVVDFKFEYRKKQ